MEVIKVCNLGDYVEFDHEPTAVETGDAIAILLSHLINDILSAKEIWSVRTIIKPKQHMYDRHTGYDPLACKCRVKCDGHWTVALKVVAVFDIDKTPDNELTEGVEPKGIQADQTKDQHEVK